MARDHSRLALPETNQLVEDVMNAHIELLATTAAFNIITMTDSYKVTHWKQYPKGTTRIFSFFESRGGVYPAVTFYGLQYYLKKYLAGIVVNEQFIAKARRRFKNHFGTDTL